MTRMHRIVLGFVLCGAVAYAPAARAADAEIKPAPQGSPAQADRVISKGLEYLKTQQHPDFSWQTPSDPPAITAIVLKAYMGDPKYDADEHFLEKAFDKLLAYQKPDGSISEDLLATYNTAIAISALAASREAEYKEAIGKAVKYLEALQWSDSIEGLPDRNKKVDPADPNFGGWGYGKKGRADGSNVQIALDALHDSGLKPDDPAYQAALKFVTRLQNNSETNDQKWASNDGGFIYTPADGGASMAGEYTGPDGRKMLRSYGSMTYAGLKSMIYAGLTKDDPRVKAAWDWIRKNWTLDENPGIKYADPGNSRASDAGLFYYYHTLARALHAYGEPVITDSKGVSHDWRLELIQKLAEQQKPDGSWVGIQKWMENKPILSTAFSVLALEEARKDLKDHPVK